MAQPPVRFENVSKKFLRGERFSSLRDLVPAVARSVFRVRAAADADPREFWALRNVSFDVRPGEALGIIGPNGAGKSTVLKILTRILRPDRGRASVHGRIGALVEIAAGFHPDLTGRENVYLQGAIMGMKRAEIARKFDEIVDFAGLAEFIDTPVKRYSSGMNARLGFAVAAHLDPEVLLIDEVLSVGDLAFQAKCYERMQRFARSGIAIVFVSHNLSAISTLCNRVLVLRHGEVQSLAPTEEALTAYATLVHGARATGDREELLVDLCDAEGRPLSEVDAGGLVRVRCIGRPSSDVGPVYSELQVRHLQTGNVIFRCQSIGVGAPPLRLARGETLRSDWTFTANLGRGHYAVTCVLLDERHQWVAVSNPGLLAVNERASQAALVYLAPRCTAEVARAEAACTGAPV